MLAQPLFRLADLTFVSLMHFGLAALARRALVVAARARSRSSSGMEGRGMSSIFFTAGGIISSAAKV